MARLFSTGVLPYFAVELFERKEKFDLLDKVTAKKPNNDASKILFDFSSVGTTICPFSLPDSQKAP